MNEINKTVIKERYASVADLMEYTSTGRNKAMALGEEAGAKIKLGRRAVYDLRIIDAYLEKLRKEQLKSIPGDKADIVTATKEARAEYNRKRELSRIEDQNHE